MNNLKIAVISDIHLAAKNNPTKNIINNLCNALPDNEETAELDIVFLAGDVFDRLVNLPEDEVFEIDMFICYLLQLCKKHNIKLRVLDGTKSHDWFQSARFVELNNIVKYKTDVVYVRDLSIEYIEEYGINILYVPDEWSTSTQDTLDQVRTLLSVKGLDKVDFAIMHGQFDYQMPLLAKKIPVHDSKAYLDIVREYIFIGHVHTHTFFDRIVAQGSFDRLSHGEEEPKGHVRAEINLDTSEKQWFFIENKGAKIYKTIKCSDRLNLESSLNKIKTQIKNVPDYSAIRVYANKGHPILENKHELTKIAPLMVWTVFGKEEQTKEQKFAEEDKAIESGITITSENIHDLLMGKIEAIEVNDLIYNKCSELLKEII
jgi:DNA repair exonuclease SbcCD nuclease subunit